MTTFNASEFSDIDDKKEFYLKRVDTLANERRFVDATQQEIYMMKVDEARAGGGVMLRAEADELAISLPVLCKTVLQQHDERSDYNRAVELARIKAKSLIRSSGSVNEMYAAFKAFKQFC